MALKREVSILQQENNHLRQLVELTESTGGDGGSQVTGRGLFSGLGSRRIQASFLDYEDDNDFDYVYVNDVNENGDNVVRAGVLRRHPPADSDGRRWRSQRWLRRSDRRQRWGGMARYCMRHDLIQLDIRHLLIVSRNLL